MANHVGEFMKLHGSLLPFTQQGLEKYNDIMTKQYFRCTSHKGIQALNEIVQKQNRLEHFQDTGLQTTKCFTVSYGNCLEKRHTI